MTVTVGTGTSGTRFVNSDYPISEGLILGTTKLSSDPALIPEESTLSENSQIGL